VNKAIPIQDKIIVIEFYVVINDLQKAQE
jgi:hypothetical protein